MLDTNPTVLIVDDESENLKALERTLRNRFAVETCQNALDGLERIKHRQFAVIISDQRMPGMLGTEFLREVAKRHPATTRIILTAFTESKEMLDAINRAEIYRYVTKPWNNEELISTVNQGAERYRFIIDNQRLIGDLERNNRHLVEKEKQLIHLNQSLEKLVAERTSELRHANEKLSELAMTDALTKLHNRRAFMAKFQGELERAKRYGHRIAIAMLDVDWFKKFNDQQGHLLGDEALRKIAQCLISRLRKTDVLARYGGEEFILMMPETSLESGTEICRRLRAGVESEVFQGQHGNVLLTISLGVSGFPVHGDTPEALIEAADQALYQAKAMGRNQVVTKSE